MDVKFFLTLDFASGYWQVKVHVDSIEKTAFITPQGLYEFHVMPFGLANAPAVFQWVMHKMLHGLNTENGSDFVSVYYIDDILIFSRTQEEHVSHIERVLQCIVKAGLKLKPTKCFFIQREVEYLGHIITPDGLKVNPAKVAAVMDFPVSKSVHSLRQFLGLVSCYRKFIAGFAAIAHPLHALTCKGVEFHWSTECEAAFGTLKSCQSSAPILVYPDFTCDFVLETNVSSLGLRAILSQSHDNFLHPVAYASRALSHSMGMYSLSCIFVWPPCYYHLALKSVLENHSSNGKHARWWTKIYS